MNKLSAYAFSDIYFSWLQFYVTSVYVLSEFTSFLPHPLMWSLFFPNDLCFSPIIYYCPFQFLKSPNYVLFDETNKLLLPWTLQLTVQSHDLALTTLAVGVLPKINVDKTKATSTMLTGFKSGLVHTSTYSSSTFVPCCYITPHLVLSIIIPHTFAVTWLVIPVGCKSSKICSCMLQLQVHTYLNILSCTFTGHARLHV
jgi:hypothetical protein